MLFTKSDIGIKYLRDTKIRESQGWESTQYISKREGGPEVISYNWRQF